MRNNRESAIASSAEIRPDQNEVAVPAELREGGLAEIVEKAKASAGEKRRSTIETSGGTANRLKARVEQSHMTKAARVSATESLQRISAPLRFLGRRAEAAHGRFSRRVDDAERKINAEHVTEELKAEGKQAKREVRVAKQDMKVEKKLEKRRMKIAKIRAKAGIE